LGAVLRHAAGGKHLTDMRHVSNSLTAEDVLALAWDRMLHSASTRLEAEALHIGVALFAELGLHAIWRQKQGTVWRNVASGGVRTDTNDYAADLVEPGIHAFLIVPEGGGSVGLIFLCAAYVQDARASVWRLARSGIWAGSRLPQKVTAGDVRTLLDDAELGSPRVPLAYLAGEIENTRRHAVVARAIQATLPACRARRNRFVDAKATLRGLLQTEIERSLSRGEGDESTDVQHARAGLTWLEGRVPGTDPLPELELIWHGAARDLARIYVEGFGDDAASSYQGSSAVRFIQSALSKLGLGHRHAHTIEMALRGRSPSVRHT
jgi:hypothetical protein